MILVADASPIFFMAKLNRLAVVPKVFAGTILMPESVQRELTGKSIPPHERQRIDDFLKQCRVERVRAPRVAASALSLADRHVLALAGKHPRTRTLTDDAVVRRIALAEGIPVTGTFGLIIRAVRGGNMTSSEGRGSVETLIGEHGMRVSVDLYQEAMQTLQ